MEERTIRSASGGGAARSKADASWPPPPVGFVPAGVVGTSWPAAEERVPVSWVDPEAVLADPLAWRGPTNFSNWVVRGRVLAGAYPGDGMNQEQHRQVVKSILDAGVTTFVCLQLASELNRFRPYRDDALTIWESMQQQNKKDEGECCTERKQLQFLHFPIPDQYVVEDDKVLALVDELEHRFHAGEVIYIHCWGGHGRTGTIVACLLARLHRLTGAEGAEKTLDLTSALHCSRVHKKGTRSPQHPIQFTQVRRLVGGPPPEPDA